MGTTAWRELGRLAQCSSVTANPPFRPHRGCVSVTSDQRWLYVAIGAALSVVFLIDARMALGFTPWLLYIVPIGLTFWAGQQYAPYVVASFCTCLLLAGYVFSPPFAPASIATTNRIIGTITFWLLACLIVEYKRLARRLSRLTDDLRSELVQRTHDLSCAVSVLRAEDVRGVSALKTPGGDSDELRRRVTDVLRSENRRLRETMLYLVREDPHPSKGEGSLEATRAELEQLGKQLEQLQRDLLRR